jgi:hypothetical protein
MRQVHINIKTRERGSEAQARINQFTILRLN